MSSSSAASDSISSGEPAKTASPCQEGSERISSGWSAAGGQLVGGVGQRAEIESQLAVRIDQPVALSQQKLLAFDDDRQLGQRPLDARHALGQRLQLALDGRRRNARRQQFGQPPGGGDFLKIEVRQTAHFAGRHDQAAAMPTADHGHRHFEQFGQHGGRVQPADALLPLDQTEPLPELGFGDDFQLAAGHPAAQGVVETFSITSAGREQFAFADDHQIDRGVEPLDDRAVGSTEQLLGFAPGHAPQLADKGHPPAGKPAAGAKFRAVQLSE